ncbi:MAG: acetate--CoA ligase family protein [Acidimicrobiales bacterium]|nr:acetate--CoA ligase family protein [Acidimicrobiales bacterium]
MSTMSEAQSKQLLARHGVPVLDERTVTTVDDAVAAAAEMGYPVVAKLCGDAIAHKTERGLVRLNLADGTAVESAAGELFAAARPEDGEVSVLVAPMVKGSRELIAGVVRDHQFGAQVMLGLGGILAEAVGDVVFRPVPLSRTEAASMIDELRSQALLAPFRGEPAVDRERLIDVLAGLAALAAEDPNVVSVDVNPLIVVDGRPVAVDALVELGDEAVPSASPTTQHDDAGFRALFEPRGVIVAGASTHPGKFGFVALHNLLASGYQGRVGATNREGGEILGIPTVPSVAELDDGPWDLVVVCTPAAANPALLRECAAKGVGAAFVTSAGYGEAGEDGARAEADLVALADELGMLLAGPNGQGVVSTPAGLCAQIVAPYPPEGRIAIVSQSGNFVSSFQNLAVHSGVGVSRAVSAGNAAAVGVADFLDWYADDDASGVSLAYLEGVSDGAALGRRLRSCAERKPVVVLKGGTTSGGQRAAASHTGALASDDRIFDGVCAWAGVTRAHSVEEAYEAAATFATQPLPKGPRTAILTTAGGWGVVTADAVTRSGLELVDLPDDLRDALDQELPPRWSRNNPIDLAGGETRDTIPTVMRLVAEHPGIDAIVYLGIGIQSNQARLARSGSYYPEWGLERIVEFHERQDARYAQAAADLSEATGKPILVATELAIADPTNAGPATVRATGRLCYPAGPRAVRALDHLWRYRRWLDQRG